MEQKKSLHSLCCQILLERVEQAQRAMDAAQRDANSETKSSAGDKYETGRAMAHLDKEMHTKRQAIAQSELQLLRAIDISFAAEEVSFGSLVKTNTGVYFIAVGMGRIELEGIQYMVISVDSPLGKVLLGAEEGESVAFRDKTIIVQAIW